MIITGMRAMTVNTFFLYRFMDKLFSLEIINLVGMTLKTDVISTGTEEFGKVRFVRAMTHRTAAYSSRAVYEFAGKDFFVMAEEA
ncbi:hypothetical protein NBG4_510014 [Candidatus Sulfobium mesophilum]|uniref:Uncharacterized protein n=1 Tax=Candidatus Sulfobium mesophilum TaxID=2016548 RepID=A0A2U3QIY7_9BACT|nr:hypothetical protein NBG4_510014 [Candidatus Sulfobium mesophilum]